MIFNNFSVMNGRKKFYLVVCFVISSVGSAVSQNNAPPANEPVAYLSYNAEKLGSTNGTIVYATSFFIKHIVMDEKSKQQHVATFLKSNPSFSKLELKNFLDNKDAKENGIMVIVDLKATDNTDLTNKIKILLTELKVKNVNYSNAFYQLQDFKF